MDEEILKTILRSSESAVKCLQDEDRAKLIQVDRLTVTCSFIFDAVCASLTNLLCHPVSKEAYQRYSVQLQVIDMLREWCRIKCEFQHCRSVLSKQRTLDILGNLLEKYLTDGVLLDNDCDEHLTQFASALLALLPTRPSLEPYLAKLLIRLSRSELSPDTERLLRHVISKNVPLTLNPATLGEIYVSQRERFVEEPLLNQFHANCTDLQTMDISKDNTTDDHTRMCSIYRLLEITAESPQLFSHVCHFLKNLLLYLEYAPAVLDFIKFVLNIVTNNRQNNRKNMLDLYPKHLQSLVIVLRSEPTEYSGETRGKIIRQLATLLFENKDDVLILLSHFPVWLGPFENYVELSRDYHMQQNKNF